MLLYIGGILVLLAQILFNSIGLAWDRIFIDKLRQTAQNRTHEYKNFWLGVEMQQFAGDLMAYSDLVYNLRPEVVIETGTYKGGLTVYLSSLMERLRPDGEVITVDLYPVAWNETVASKLIPVDLARRITFIQGDSVSDEILSRIKAKVAGRSCLVILDSYHAGDHVLKELNLYSGFVPVGGYIIVNDTHLEQMGVLREGLFTRIFNPEAGRGPFTAVKKFLKETNEFQIEASLPRTMVSCAPSGFLKRIRPKG